MAGSPQLEFDHQGSSDDESAHEDGDDANVAKRERAQSDLESSSSSGPVKRHDDS